MKAKLLAFCAVILISKTLLAHTSNTFDVVPATAETATTVSVPAHVVNNEMGDAKASASTFNVAYQVTTRILSIKRSSPSPTAMNSVSFLVEFSENTTGLTASNLSLTMGGTISGASITSVSNAGKTFTVIVNTGTGDGTLKLNLVNSYNLSPVLLNAPHYTGEEYTITKTFAASPELTIAGRDSRGSGDDVTAFVDMVEVLDDGTPFANALQNGSFETHPSYYNGSDNTWQLWILYGTSWTFNVRAGIADVGGGFSPPSPAPGGIAVGVIQTENSVVGQIGQQLKLPTGNNYQVRFKTAQRPIGATRDQVLSVFLNDVFMGSIQPADNNVYVTFTSASFAVTAPALTTVISSSAANPTSTSPIPFTVTFSQAVTGFVKEDITVANGIVGGFTGSGTTYNFNVTPTTSGAVSVNVAAGVAVDDNNTNNTAATEFTMNYNSVLPVSMLSYTAKAEGNAAKLQWQTTQEVNNLQFAIYRSGDDKAFVKIGEVSANINHQPLNINHYSYVDKRTLNGNNYYKLVQVDQDGKTNELGERALNFKLSTFDLQLYPNPTTSKVVATFGVGKFTSATLTGIDGKVLKTVQLTDLQQELEIDLSAYPVGMYFMRLIGADESVVKKVIKQ